MFLPFPVKLRQRLGIGYGTEDGCTVVFVRDCVGRVLASVSQHLPVGALLFPHGLQLVQLPCDLELSNAQTSGL